MTGKTVRNDFSRGSIPAVVMRMALPLIAAQLVNVLYNVVDRIYIGHIPGIGSMALTGVGIALPVISILSAFAGLFGQGGAPLCSMARGRGDGDEASRVMGNAFSMLLVSSVALGLLTWAFLDPVVEVFGAGEEASGYAREYLAVYLIGTTFSFVSLGMNVYINAQGFATRGMLTVLLGAVSNIVLDPIFIYVLNLGLTGAGIATAVASTASAALGLWWYARGRLYLTMSFDDMRPRMADLKEILYVGIPRGTESMLISVMSLVQRIFVIACGGTSAAMFYNIPWRFVSLTEVISQAVGSALIPVCSANLGRGDFAKAEQGYRYSYTVTMVVMIAIAAVIFVFADWIIIPFTYSESMAALRPEFVHVLRIYALLIPFMGLIDIGSSILQSLRMAQISMFSSFARNILIVVLLFFASSVSLDAIYWSLVASEVFGGALMVWLARSGLKHYRRGRERPDPAS